ncbi:uncharacterized protein [Halyomorpha halys]|uniref:uncharacterized protein isoform X2 n=1 Tax=Halyomorpha halys TaxID=286706 RepID=UPI0006D4E5C7|nr:uncharacterized protein LOC106688980 isoform X2 [Halyomorpha halys]
MPNEVTSLLNALNSYITCPVCKVTNEIEIILTCGHLICKNCRTKRTKCPVCYSELSTTRLHSPSIKFIEELNKELLKAYTGKINFVESVPDVGNSIITPNGNGEQTVRNGSATIDNDKIKKKTNFGLREDVEISYNNVKITNEINLLRNKDNNKNHNNHKKGIGFYRNYCKHKEERKVYRKILKGLGIVGIDKKVKNVKSEHALNAKEKELNGQLNTIISRLNDQYANNDNLKKNKFNYSLNILTDSDSSDSDQSVKMNFDKDFGVIECDLKRNEFNLNKNCGGLKRKNSDSVIEEAPPSKAFVKNIGIVDDCIQLGTVNLSTLDKKLGGIVDETEIVQRYLNSSMEVTEKEVNKNDSKSSNNPNSIHRSFLPKNSEFPDKSHSITNTTITDDKKCERFSKSKIKNIISEFMGHENPNSEKDGLQSDIMADMLHNVSNEIVMVGNTLCTLEENNDICNSSINDSSVASNLKNLSADSSSCKNSDNKIHPITIIYKPETKSGDNNIIEVIDSEDDAQDVGKHAISESSQTKSDLSDIHSEKDINVMNCRIVLKDLAPQILKSEDEEMHEGNDECLRKSNASKILNVDCTGEIDLKNKSPKNGKMDADIQKRIAGNNSINLMQATPQVPLEQKIDRSDEVSNNFEGFTEDDILILTVKLALFKMNGFKYSRNLSSTSFFTLDGKQILIKDVSQEESYPGSPCCPNKISDLTIEISDSEDESNKSLVSSSVQTENEQLTVTPSPSTSKIRPVSLVKLHGFELENEKFMQNDVLDIRKPLTPNTPLGKESIASSLSQSSHTLRTTPVSRRQLSFYQDDGASTSDLKTIGSVPNSSLNDNWQVLHYRMQHMIPSKSEDALHSEFERTGISPTRLTFTTCGLNSKETALVTKLAQMTKSCLTKDFTHNTTHLVIGATGRGRLEYYLAIAYRAFIVTMDWVTLCLALNKILPVTGFIPTEDEGPLKCLEPNALPFAGFHVFSKILPTSSSYPIAEITKTLLSLGGARVLPNLDAFHTLQDGNFPRFFIYNCKSVLTQAILDKCSSLHILPIQFMWVYESIGAFRAIPVMDFLDIGVHSRTLIRDYKIPDHLACSRYPRLEGEFHPQILDERYQRSL